MTPRILLVEDDELVRHSISRLLQASGYIVIEAENGRTALASISQEPIDLVVTDVIMPEMDGVELIVALRRSHPDLKIIAMSGGGISPVDNYLDIARSLHADRALEKPVAPWEFLAAVRALVGTPSPKD